MVGKPLVGQIMMMRSECVKLCKSRISESSPLTTEQSNVWCLSLGLLCSRNQMMNLETLVKMTKRRYGYTPWYIPERLSTCDTVRMLEKGERAHDN